jgi:hypothetical protein
MTALPIRTFDPNRARETARRLREGVERARYGLPPEPVRPLFAGETAKDAADRVITSIGPTPGTIQ